MQNIKETHCFKQKMIYNLHVSVLNIPQHNTRILEINHVYRIEFFKSILNMTYKFTVDNGNLFTLKYFV